jgi:hypothetical protein
VVSDVRSVSLHLILGQVLLVRCFLTILSAAIAYLACLGWVASRRPGAARPPGVSGTTSLPYRQPRLPGLSPGHRVVALGEVDGMPPSPLCRS